MSTETDTTPQPYGFHPLAWPNDTKFFVIPAGTPDSQLIDYGTYCLTTADGLVSEVVDGQMGPHTYHAVRVILRLAVESFTAAGVFK